MVENTSIPTSATGLAGFILQRLENWRQNRSTLQAKWERNRQAFLAIAEGQWKEKEAEDWRSDTFVRITHRKVMAAFALVLDNLLQGGRIPFDLVPASEPAMDSPEQTAMIEEAIDDMKGLIDEQFQECNADRSLMKAVMSMALYGRTWAKKTVQDITKTSYQQNQYAGISDLSRLPQGVVGFNRAMEQRISPSWDYLPVWDIFWDMETEDLKAGAGIIHRRLVSPWWLRQKKGKPYFFDDKIQTVLSNATKSETASSSAEKYTDSLAPVLREIKYRQNTIFYAEHWGRVPKTQVENFESDLKNSTNLQELPTLVFNEQEESGDEIECLCCVANTEVVRFARTETRQRPFFTALWEDSLDEGTGNSVADNLEDVQFVLNGAVRAFEDNKKLSCNVVFTLLERAFVNPPKSVTPGMILLLKNLVEDVNKAFGTIQIPDQGESLLSLIELMEKYGDEDGMIPKISQGMQEQTDQTAFETAQRIAQAGKYVGSAIRNVDEGLIEPIATDFFDYNMDDPSVSKGKGNFKVKATGYAGFQDRILRVQAIQRLLGILLSNPGLTSFGKYRPILEDIANASDVDPERYIKSVQELQEEAMQIQAMRMEQTKQIAAGMPAEKQDEGKETGGIAPSSTENQPAESVVV